MSSRNRKAFLKVVIQPFDLPREIKAVRAPIISENGNGYSSKHTQDNVSVWKILYWYFVNKTQYVAYVKPYYTEKQDR